MYYVVRQGFSCVEELRGGGGGATVGGHATLGFAPRCASVWASKVETSKAEGAYVSPARGRVTVGDLSVGWLSRQEQTLSPSYYRTISYAYGKHVGPKWPASR